MSGHALRSDRVFTTGQVARMLGASPRTVTQWCDSGLLGNYRLPSPKRHGDRRIPRDTLVQFLLERGIPLPPELDSGARRLLVLSARPHLASALAEALGQAWVVIHASCGYRAGVTFHQSPCRAVLIDSTADQADRVQLLRDCLAQRPRIPVAWILSEDDATGVVPAGVARAWQWPTAAADVAAWVQAATGSHSLSHRGGGYLASVCTVLLNHEPPRRATRSTTTNQPLALLGADGRLQVGRGAITPRRGGSPLSDQI